MFVVIWKKTGILPYYSQSVPNPYYCFNIFKIFLRNIPQEDDVHRIL